MTKAGRASTALREKTFRREVAERTPWPKGDDAPSQSNRREMTNQQTKKGMGKLQQRKANKEG